MEDKYMDYGLSITHRVLITELGIKVAITPYDNTRTEKD